MISDAEEYGDELDYDDPDLFSALESSNKDVLRSSNNILGSLATANGGPGHFKGRGAGAAQGPSKNNSAGAKGKDRDMSPAPAPSLAHTPSSRPIGAMTRAIPTTLRRAVPPNAKRPRVEQQNPFVHTGIPLAAVAGPSKPDKVVQKNHSEEGDAPGNSSHDSGNYSAAMPPPAPPAAPVSVPRLAKQVPKLETPRDPPAAARPVEGAALIAELEKLRQEKAALLSEKQKIAAEAAQYKKTLVTKEGEMSIVRRRFEKSEAALTESIESKRLAEVENEKKMQLKERDFRTELEKLRVDTAFERQEFETSRRAASQWNASASRVRSASIAPKSARGGAAYAPAVGSPSLGRGKVLRADNQMLPPPAFPSFNNSFTPARASRVETGSGSPKRPLGGILGQKTPGIKPRHDGFGVPEGFSPNKLDKGKGKMMIDDALHEETADEMMELDAAGLQDWGMVEEQEEREGYEEPVSERDWRGEILSAIFNHTTFVHFASDSATIPVPATQGASSAMSRNSSASGPLNLPAPLSAPTLGPLPTFHSLTNFRFPPGTPHEIEVQYEEVCREFFMTLGKRAGRSGPAEDDKDEFELARGIGMALEKMARILVSAGVMGPLISLFSLLSYLILLFPPFALCFLNHPRSLRYRADNQGLGSPSKLLPLLGSIITRFGRPSPVVKALDSSNRGKARERSRRMRGIVEKPVAVFGADERVDIDLGKRTALLLKVLDILEGLAWRIDESREEQFSIFVGTTDVMATLLDLAQPMQILNGAIRFLSLLACRPNLFRPILDIKFYDVVDAANRSIPIFDRTAMIISGRRPKRIQAAPEPTLSLSQATTMSSAVSTISQAFTIQMSALAFINILSVKHADAMMLVGNSAVLIPELLGTIFADVRILWGQDGKYISDLSKTILTLTVERLAACVHLFYFLTCSPAAVVKFNDFASRSFYVGLQDRFISAFGTLAFAGLPEWAVDSEEGILLCSLTDLASDIMEDITPSEVDQIERCFHLREENALMEGEEDLARGDGDEVMADEEELALRENYES